MGSKRMNVLAHALIAITASTATFHAGAQGNWSDLRGSEAISVGTLSILAAPLARGCNGGPVTGVALASIGGFYVISGVVEAAGDSVEVVLDAVKGAGKLSVRVTKGAFDMVGASVGATVEVSAIATGTLLVASGKVLAFIPNTVGEPLLHHSRVPGEPT